MKIDSPLENLKESISEIEESITKGLVSKQRTLGFNSSAGAIDMLEIILHKQNLNEWFNSEKTINKKFNFDFPRKKEIMPLIMKIENIRNKLCYGKRQQESLLKEQVDNFNKLKKIFMEITEYEL